MLVCAPSNIAVDTILMRLVEMLSRNKNGKSTTQINLEQFRNQIIRLGHPARVSSGILDFTLDSHIDHDEVFISHLDETINNMRFIRALILLMTSGKKCKNCAPSCRTQDLLRVKMVQIK